MRYYSTKVIELGSAAFRQPNAKSHCRFIHGYRLTGKFTFTSETLDTNNWVVDFGDFDELKGFLQEKFDHTLVLAKNDPAMKEFEALEKAGAASIVIMDEGVGIEMFAKYCFNAADSYVKHKTNGRVRAHSVEVFEHEKNSAIYTAESAEETLAEVADEVEAAAPAKGKGKKGKAAEPAWAPPAKAEKQTEALPYDTNKPVRVIPKQTDAPPQGVPVGGKNRPSTWDFGTKWA
jgi:6-pyruvoyltetrahydropterin/6-carboxytetrahydropterin synthase